MLLPTKAIVLQVTKYSDSSVIINLLTKERGRISVMLYGIRNKKQSKLIAFQPLYLLDVIIDVKDNRNIQVLKEYKLSPPLFNISSDPIKITMAMFLAELLNKCLKEETPDNNTFDFINTSINIFEELEEGIGLFHLAFLIKFSRYLGFCPAQGKGDFKFFDFKLNKEVNEKPYHNFFITHTNLILIHKLLNCQYNELYNLKLSIDERNNLLDSVVLMYEVYIINFSGIKSFDVLKQVFT